MFLVSVEVVKLEEVWDEKILKSLNSMSESILEYKQLTTILVSEEAVDFLDANGILVGDGKDVERVQKMLEDKNAIMGLGDGGAHVGFILDAGYPTWLISYWSVKKKVFSMEETIRRLTSDTADAAGLSDRGILKVGLKADVNLIDWENVGSSDPFMTQDLPAGGKRLMQHTHGYVCLLYTSDAADEEDSVDLGGRRIIKKKNTKKHLLY